MWKVDSHLRSICRVPDIDWCSVTVLFPCPPFFTFNGCASWGRLVGRDALCICYAFLLFLSLHRFISYVNDVVVWDLGSVDCFDHVTYKRTLLFSTWIVSFIELGVCFLESCTLHLSGGFLFFVSNYLLELCIIVSPFPLMMHYDLWSGWCKFVSSCTSMHLYVHTDMYTLACTCIQ